MSLLRFLRLYLTLAALLLVGVAVMVGPVALFVSIAWKACA